MDFRTVIDIQAPGFRIDPFERLLFVGSCFADSIGQRFVDEKFRATVNPFGVMYNPASILHTVERLAAGEGQPTPAVGKASPWWAVAFLTLGTNRVYRLKSTGQIVDNCQKRPQSLFAEESLTVDECVCYLRRAIDLLQTLNPAIKVVLTVSPIRYRKYGYHGSQLSKSTLLLAADEVCRQQAAAAGTPASSYPAVTYFPAYEIVVDELRDYRFYAPDMLHPSPQAVDYIWERLSALYLSDAARQFISEWQPLKAALAHRPFQPESDEYRAFVDKTMLKVAALQKKYPNFAL